MKKLLLVLPGVMLMAFNANAQYRMSENRAYQNPKPWQVTEPASTVNNSSRIPGPVNVAATQPLGTAQNAFGAAFGAKTQLWCDPILNAVMFTHRNTVAVNGGSSGNMRADVSTDGGNTFTIDKLIYDYASNANIPGRYPQGAIYNPAGNTNIANAYYHVACPLLDGSNQASGWGGFAFASQKSDGTNPGLSSSTSDATTGLYWYIANDMFPAKNGVNYILSPALELTTLQDYTDNLIFSKGTWNTTTNSYDYTHTLIPAPVSVNATGGKVIADQRIAFGDNSTTGYMMILGHDNYTANPDSCYYPIIWKTTDGGTTWTGPTRLNLGNLYSILTGGVSGDPISTAFEADVAVDANNNLHIAVDVAFGGGFSISTANGFHAIVDIYTTDGGTSWYAQPMGYPQTFRGTFGDGSTANANLNEDNRPQMSRTWDGSKMFVSWFDTDTTIFTGLGNTYPDMYVRGFNPSANTMTPVVAGSATGLEMMGNVTYYTLTCGTSDYKVPFVSQVITGTDPTTGAPLNTGSAVQFNYTDDACVAASAFTAAPTAIPLSVYSGINDIQTITASSVTVVPNPSNGITTISYLLNSSADIKVRVVDMLGKVVANFNEGNKAAGMHQIQFNTNSLASGIYTVSVTSASQVESIKLVVE